MKISRITTEQGLFFIIILVALGIRILNIGDIPLSDFEAEKVLQALHVSRGESTNFSPGPAFPLLTGVIFFLLSDNNALARLWPILAGCCLVIFPYFIRSLIGRKAAIIMAIGLALDPTLVVFSRIGGNEFMAVGFGVMTFGLVYYRKPIYAGIFAGLTILSGPSALQGLLGIGIAWFIGDLLLRRGIVTPLIRKEPGENQQKALRSGFLAAGSVILVLGTLFFIFPEGLSSLTSILPSYLAGWTSISEISASRLLSSLVFYNTIVIIFGVLAIVQGWLNRDNVSQWLSFWAGTSFLLAIIYPARDIFGLAWFLVPLWGLAAIEIARYFRIRYAEPLPAIGQAVLILLLLALGWLNLTGLSMSDENSQAYQLRWAVIGGTVLLGGVTTILIGLGWSRKTAQQGLVWGLLLGLGFYSISTMWGLSQLRPTGEQELFAPFPVANNTGDLQATLGDLSEWRTGSRNSLDIVLTSSAPSLIWEMRDWPEARFLNSIPIGELPSIIISNEDQPEPNLSIGYRGQGFAWSVYPGWQGALPDNWPSWLVFRDAPQTENNIILWARGDLFPGGVLGESNGSSLEDEGDFPIGELPVE
jgi:hypothetical protein